MVNFESVIKKQADYLIDIAKELTRLRPVEKKTFNFNMKDISTKSEPKELLADIKNWERMQNSIVIYFFSIQGSFDLESLYAKIVDAKKEKNAQRAYPRINSPSKCLYVGSSEKIGLRVKEHLGFGHKQTYAMNLVYWCGGIDLELDIVCWRFKKNVNKVLIQSSEDALWEQLKPMLGRQGAR